MPSTPYTYIPLISPAFRALRRRVRLLRYSGDAVECLCCGQRFSSWVGQKPTGDCPSCGAITRQKLLVHALKEHAPNAGRDLQTLYFAPDPGPMAWLAQAGRFVVTTTDYSAPDVDVHWDITDIPQRDDSYDVILCSHVLEHVPDDRRAMSELHRILSPGGTLFFQVPYARDKARTDEEPTLTDPEERTRRFGQFDHIRLYGRDLLDRLQEAGFDVSAVTAEDRFGADQMARFGLWNDVLFICTKKASQAQQA